jgi:hypothetical protein
MRCPQCGGALNGPGSTCPRCAPQQALALSEDVGPLLTRANLLRMRGHWAEAADECVQVLHRDPANPTAHSLLGDVYQDQGRPEEARYWYQLALELSPHSKADRAKLARSEETLEARRQRAEWEAVIEGRAQPVATSLLVRESLQRVAAVAGAALCGIILVMATLVSVRERTEPLDGPSVYARPGRRPTPILPDTRAEQRLIRQVADLAPGGAGQLARVELDPVADLARLRVYLPRSARDGVTTPDFRIRVLKEGYRFAHALHQADDVLTRIRVQVVGPSSLSSGEAETETLLIGTLQAHNLAISPEVVSLDELQSFYEEGGPVLWSPELKAASQ